MANRIRELREARGLSQESLARAVGWGENKMKISRLERGRLQLKADDILAIAKALGVHPALIFTDDKPLDEAEEHLLELFRAVGDADREKVIRIIEAFAPQNDETDPPLSEMKRAAG